MRRKGILRRDVFRKDRRQPRDLASFVDQVQRRGRQGRNVQGLANVAGRVRSAAVLVDVKTPPAAKYNTAAQPNMASARLPEMSLTQFIYVGLHTLV